MNNFSLLPETWEDYVYWQIQDKKHYHERQQTVLLPFKVVSSTVCGFGSRISIVCLVDKISIMLHINSGGNINAGVPH